MEEIVGQIQPSTANDEIGDLSRHVNSAAVKLGHYKLIRKYVSRLSMEYATPVAIVKLIP